MKYESCEIEPATIKIFIERIPRQDYTESEISLCKSCAEEITTWKWLLEQIDNNYIWKHYLEDQNAN